MKHRSTAACAVHVCRFVLVYVSSVEDPHALRCQYHRFYSVADSAKYNLRFDCAILGNLHEAAIQACETKSTDSVNPYFAYNIYIDLNTISQIFPPIILKHNENRVTYQRV